MDKRQIYTLPQKERRTLSRNAFIVRCLLFGVIGFMILNVISFWIFGSTIGYFPSSAVVVLADVLDIVGCIYYIRKHDFAYGNHYEIYQAINSAIYGIQNYLRVLLITMMISILVVPIYYTVIMLAIIIAMFQWTRRL